MSSITKFAAGFWTVLGIAAVTGSFDPPHAAEVAQRPSWTALSVSSEGVWGVATGVTEHGAKLAAVATCKAKFAWPDDCNSRVSTSQGGWHQAYACGEQHFTVSGVNLHGVTMIAAYQVAELKLASTVEIPECRLIVSISPSGEIDLNTGM